MHWFLENRPDLARHIACMEPRSGDGHVPPAARHPVARAARARAALPARRERVPLAARHPLAVARSPRAPVRVRRRRRESTAWTTCPAESNTGLFGGNSNWRGPVWFPINYLLIEALERYHHFYGDDAQGRVPDRLGPDAEPAGGRAASSRARLARSSCRTRPAAGPATATTRASPSDPALEGPGAVPRVLPRRQRPRRRAPATRPAGPRSCVRCIEDLARRRGATATRQAERRPAALAASRR